jgi:hypothetical protein
MGDEKGRSIRSFKNDIAPGIVSVIDQTPERETIYRNIWETYLCPNV